MLNFKSLATQPSMMTSYPSVLLRPTQGAYRLLLMACVLAFGCLSASATVVSYIGADLAAGPNQAHPNSFDAQANYLLATQSLGLNSIVNFEQSPLGSFMTLQVAPGVTATSVPYADYATIKDVPHYQYTNDPSVYYLAGFNTTTQGAKYIDNAGTVTFTFAQPIQAFGVYLTGVQPFFNDDTVTFSDGTMHTVHAVGVSSDYQYAYLEYIGFTDPGASIYSVSISSDVDIIGIDDVTYVPTVPASTGVTPEPSSFALLLTGVGAMGAGYRRLRGR